MYYIFISVWRVQDSGFNCIVSTDFSQNIYKKEYSTVSF